MRDRQRPARALVIGGQPRSGTTLLGRLVNKHPSVVTTFELRLFQRLNQSRKSVQESLRLDWRETPVYQPATGPRGHRLASRVFLAALVLQLKLGRGAEAVSLDAATRLLGRCFPWASIVGDKYPHYVYQLDELVAEERLLRVMIYRDCRDVVSSTLMRARGGWKSHSWVEGWNTASKVASHWLKAIESMERNESRIHTIRYEDLVRSPETVMTKLAEYLDIDPKGFELSQVRSGSMGNYEAYLTEREVEEVWSVAGDAMRRLGYGV